MVSSSMMTSSLGGERNISFGKDTPPIDEIANHRNIQAGNASSYKIKAISVRPAIAKIRAKIILEN